MKPTESITRENVTDILKSRPVKIILIVGGTVLSFVLLTYVVRILANLIGECKNLNSVIKC